MRNVRACWAPLSTSPSTPCRPLLVWGCASALQSRGSSCASAIPNLLHLARRDWGGRCLYSTLGDDGDSLASINIPRDKIQLAFSRSSGPGGQNVNKVNTKVELRFNLNEADWIPEDVKDRLREQRAGDLNKEGEMVITSSVHRTQGHNLNEAFRKLKRYLDEACLVPKERIATEVPDYAIEHRLKEKKKRSDVKQNRQKPRWDDH